MMTLHIRTRDHKETRLELPMPPEKFQRQIQSDFGTAGPFCVAHIDGPIPNMKGHFQGLTAAGYSTLDRKSVV